MSQYATTDSLSLSLSFCHATTTMQTWDWAGAGTDRGIKSKINRSIERVFCHSNYCHLTPGGLRRASMIDLPFSVLQLFTHQQQKFQLKCSSGGIFIAADTPEAHVSLQAWISWWRRLVKEQGGGGWGGVNESPVLLAVYILSLVLPALLPQAFILTHSNITHSG